jgi:hypothetical protein
MRATATTILRHHCRRLAIMFLLRRQRATYSTHTEADTLGILPNRPKVNEEQTHQSRDNWIPACAEEYHSYRRGILVRNTPQNTPRTRREYSGVLRKRTRGEMTDRGGSLRFLAMHERKVILKFSAVPPQRAILRAV